MEKFWSNPDLVERLLPFLDDETKLQLVLSQVGCTLKVLQCTSVSRKLIKRTFPGNSQVQLGEEGENIKCLVEILKMMEEPNSYMLDLLEALCEKIPSLPDSTIPTGDVVKFSCPWHQFHSVSLLDFLLLEEVEAVVGSAVQEIKSLKFHQSIFESWPLFSALAARVSRQQGKITIGGKFLCAS